MIDNIRVIYENQEQTISVVGDHYRIIVSGKQSQGTHAVIDMLVPPGGGPGPHAHPDIDELFYVVEGEIEFKNEKGKFAAGPGTFINIPRGGEVHCFKNTGNAVAHMICTVVPAGLDELFREIGTPTEAGVFLPPPVFTAEEIARLAAAGKKHGTTVYPGDYLD